MSFTAMMHRQNKAMYGEALEAIKRGDIVIEFDEHELTYSTKTMELRQQVAERLAAKYGVSLARALGQVGKAVVKVRSGKI